MILISGLGEQIREYRLNYSEIAQTSYLLWPLFSNFEGRNNNNLIGLTVEKSKDNPDSEGQVYNFPTSAFDTTLTTEVSTFDILCALGEVNNAEKNEKEKSKVFTEDLRESRNLKLIKTVHDKSGLDFNIYEKDDTVLIAINGYNKGLFKDGCQAAHFTKNNNKFLAGVVDLLSLKTLKLYENNHQVEAMENFYKEIKEECKKNNKKLIIAGYSLGGAIAREIAILHPEDNDTRFISFNALGTGRQKGRTIENYCIEGDNMSNGKGLYTAQDGSVTLMSFINNKHSLEAFLGIIK